jgi:predicted lipid-binding transport protein (Tim44 family)
MMQQPRPSFMQRWGGAIAGFALGGLLGGLLFGGHGFGGGIGMFDILLIVGGIALLMYFLRSRRQAEEPAYAPSGASSYGYNTGAGGTAVMEMPSQSAEQRDLQDGLAHIRQMDPTFDPAALADWARAQFSSVQAAVAMRDIGMIRDRLAPEMYGVLLTQTEDLKAQKRRSYIEKIDLTRAEVTEAWQEKGQDYATVYMEGTMFDYVADEATGAVVQGSKTTPSKIEEFWTFVRPVGPNKWKLTAIQSA